MIKKKEIKKQRIDDKQMLYIQHIWPSALINTDDYTPASP